MKIDPAWLARVGQMWRRLDSQDSNVMLAKQKAWGNFLIVSTRVHENTCTVVHDVIYVDSCQRNTIVEHGGSSPEKEWSMDRDTRFTRLL